MLKTNIDGQLVSVRFAHESEHLPMRVTTAIIEFGNNEGEWIPASSGFAYCSAQDRFVKSVGRKIALTRALSRFNRHFRTQVWKAYHSR